MTTMHILGLAGVVLLAACQPPQPESTPERDALKAAVASGTLVRTCADGKTTVLRSPEGRLLWVRVESGVLGSASAGDWMPEGVTLQEFCS